MKIKLKISSSSFADWRNKPHVAWGAYEIMVATNAVLRHDFTNLRNFALLSAWCIYLLIFKKYAIKSVCVRVSTATLPVRANSYENVDISASKHPHSV